MLTDMRQKSEGYFCLFIWRFSITGSILFSYSGQIDSSQHGWLQVHEFGRGGEEQMLSFMTVHQPWFLANQRY